MQCILREKLLIHSRKLTEISNIYQTDSSRFVDAYIKWIDEAENDLSVLRSPICILLQSEKSSLNSVLDGFLPNYIQADKSIRKIQKVVAAQSLERISKEIYVRIENIDNLFDQFNEKLCHSIAVLVSKEPEVFQRLQLNQKGVAIILEKLSMLPETIPMYNYLCAKLSSTDINYILMDILQKIVSNKFPPHKTSHTQY
ncbi:MAG TPA: hypothetical protein DHV48_10320 [Prolixibacteraceae bacterium]|nr:hypothetical protein [Prolixibacteraceae bacterium]